MHTRECKYGMCVAEKNKFEMNIHVTVVSTE